MTERQHHHEPIVPKQDDQPPTWIVVCLEHRCGFAHDAHGLDPEAAIQSVAATHARGHKLIARSVDYTQHKLYQ